LKPGDVLGIVGNLGSGKTQMVKAICSGFGIPPELVTSPTFTLVHEYGGIFEKGLQRIVHTDLYRLETNAEFESLDLSAYLNPDSILLIEWADKFWPLLPGIPKRLELRIVGKNTRRFQFKNAFRP
jgi:tRNA threonylcarbamoyladenosine biosynthesis protein TsaE